jgi:hypothetical protein
MKTVNLALILGFVLLIGILFYPTLYHYEKHETSLLRINRVNGYTEVFTTNGWQSVEKIQALQAQQDQDNKTFDLFLSDLAKITGNAALTGYGYFDGQIYNGTDVILREVEIEITAKKLKSVLWKRKYKDTLYVKPLTSEKLIIPVTGDESGLSTEWIIVGAKGSKP